jgi:hypothetical protein
MQTHRGTGRSLRCHVLLRGVCLYFADVSGHIRSRLQGFAKTAVNNYKNTPHNDLDERRPRLYRSVSFSSRKNGNVLCPVLPPPKFLRVSMSLHSCQDCNPVRTEDYRPAGCDVALSHRNFWTFRKKFCLDLPQHEGCPIPCSRVLLFERTRARTCHSEALDFFATAIDSL